MHSQNQNDSQCFLWEGDPILLPRLQNVHVKEGREGDGLLSTHLVILRLGRLNLEQGSWWGGTPKHHVAWVISTGSKKSPIARDERWALLFAYGWNFPSAWKMSPFHAGDKGKFVILESKRYQEIRQPVSLCIQEGYDWKSAGESACIKNEKVEVLGLEMSVPRALWRDDTVGERPSRTSMRDWFLDPQNPCQTLGVVSHVYNPSTVVGVGSRR